MVDSTTADAVTIGQLTLGVVLGNIDDEVELVVGNHVHHIVLSILIRPADSSCLDTVLIEELGSTCGGIYLIALLHEFTGRLQQADLTLGGTTGDQYAALGGGDSRWQSVRSALPR